MRSALELGTILAPSGSLLILDPGFLGMWSHDCAPVMPEGILSAEGTVNANSSVDAHITGSDADRVGKTLSRQWNPRFVYDIPREHALQLTDRVQEIA